MKMWQRYSFPFGNRTQQPSVMFIQFSHTKRKTEFRPGQGNAEHILMLVDFFPVRMERRRKWKFKTR